VWYSLRTRRLKPEDVLNEKFFWNGEPLDLRSVKIAVSYFAAHNGRRLVDVHTWFAEEYPHSCLILAGSDFSFHDYSQLPTLWLTDNEHAALIMRMRWA
jgi:hypothetical protein